MDSARGKISSPRTRTDNCRSSRAQRIPLEPESIRPPVPWSTTRQREVAYPRGPLRHPADEKAHGQVPVDPGPFRCRSSAGVRVQAMRRIERLRHEPHDRESASASHQNPPSQTTLSDPHAKSDRTRRIGNPARLRGVGTGRRGTGVTGVTAVAPVPDSALDGTGGLA